MSSSPASKRRRLNAASSKLSQPFKSPFRTPLKPSSTDPTAHTSATHTSATHTRPARNPATPSTPTYPTSTTISPLPKPGHLRNTLPRRTIAAPPSPQLAQLQKRHTALLGTLASARASLETHTQALKLETSSTDAELEALTRKWKGVSRQAAEAVFEIVAQRVEGMGGVKGWREKEREKREGGGGWGWEEERKVENGEDEREAEEDTQRGKSSEEEDDNEETFTMSMMLRSLNIDLHLIGYDAEAQKWID